MFNLNEEQQLIREGVARFVTEQFSFNQRQVIAQSDDGFDRGQWKSFAELGWLGIGYPENYGGFGGSYIDVAQICAEQAKLLLMSPYLSCVGTAGNALLIAGTEKQKLKYLSGIADGSTIITRALFESDCPNDAPQTQGLIKGDNLRVNGFKRLVPYAAQSEYLIVNAVIDSEEKLIVIPTHSAGINLRPYRMYDASRSADVEINNVDVSVENILSAPTSDKVVSQVTDMEIALMCVEASSIMWAIHDQTLEYLKTREQFGVTLSTFQALQHRIVDVYVKCQLAQSISEDAMMAAIEAPGSEETSRRISAAKAHIGQHGREVGKEGIQLHGGIGMTGDVPIGHYFKRLSAISQLNGDNHWHQRRYLKLDPFQVI